ncbi:signal peptidase II [Irregularibacter muris]|uniref:Lipoprotein signal peptidase n=1 Tax=Irregularibacter muris TaxID=1796619 RepID=A0AAE3HH22_9FIRM|nr:signal peptidase II [Irregularibacter muris]MCR1898978.1 signal peptidase II [Irregularibacter muris]
MSFFLVIIFIVVLDQVAKYLAVLHIKPIPTYPLIRDVFHLTYVENRGAAFSIFQDKQPFLITVTMLFTLFLIYYLIKTPKNKNTLWFKISLTLIIGGAIGNLIDRIRLNYVIDFFDFRYINFAIFNTADSFVVVGTILLAGILLFGDTQDIL